MALSKVNYVDNQTIITAQNLNNIQDEIIQNTELVKKVAPRNLLDNSNFLQPVNQLGFKSGTAVESNAGFIDRWRNGGGSSITPNLSSNGIEPNGAIYQTLYLPSYVGKKMTLAVGFSEGNVVIASGILTEASTDYKIFFNTTDGINEIGIGSWGGIWIVGINCPNSIIQWAALYEGEYTTETLPEYQPKGYENELLICHQYDPYTDEYIGLSKFSPPRNLLDNSDFRNPVNQREQTSYTLNAWGGYCIDRWKAGERTTTLTINSNSCTLNGEIYQTIDPNGNAKGLNGKTVTIAAKVNGSIGCSSGTIKLTGKWTQFTDFSIPSGRCFIYAGSDNCLNVVLVTDDTVTIEWVALYEGTYTAETMPEYHPKGYGAELAECRRYYLNGVFAVTIGSQYGASRSIFSICTDEMRIMPSVTITDVIAQGWGDVDKSDYNQGWTDRIGSKLYYNFVNEKHEQDAGKTIVVCATFSADL